MTTCVSLANIGVLAFVLFSTLPDQSTATIVLRIVSLVFAGVMETIAIIKEERLKDRVQDLEEKLGVTDL